MKQLLTEAIKAFGDIMAKTVYPRGVMLHWEQEVGNSLYIVRSGILRSFYYLDGRDITAHFTIDDGIIGAADSLIKGKKSLYNIEALEDSEVFVLDYAELEVFLEKNPALERLARKVSQYLYIELVERMENMTFLSAKERYDRLLVSHPEIIMRVSQNHIASYLGITPETLSRIRNQR